MSEQTRIRPVPEGYTTVTPWIIGRDTAGLLGFLCEAFGAVELARVHGADGSIGHAEVRIGDAVVMMFDGSPQWPHTPAFLRPYSLTATRCSGGPSTREPPPSARPATGGTARAGCVPGTPIRSR